MTAKQKKFILNKLIPFILREQGRGFSMRYWRVNTETGSFYHPDLHARIKSPKCGTAACIGGSIGYLNGEKAQLICGDFAEAGSMIGLNHDQSDVLFDDDIRWPEPFRGRYFKNKTPLGKAKAAVDLLKEVVRTNGKCLDAA